jgi:hypothetical protein
MRERKAPEMANLKEISVRVAQMLVVINAIGVLGMNSKHQQVAMEQ